MSIDGKLFDDALTKLSDAISGHKRSKKRNNSR